jgi:drug/metabolite transporter (DMT)-like permease
MSTARLYVFAALTALFWGANFNMAGVVLADMAPLAAAFVRFALAALVMAAIAIHQRHGFAIVTALRLYWHKLGFIGVVGIAGFNILFFDAMRHTSAVNGALVMATNPLLTSALAALVLGETLSRRQLIAMPVAFVGVATVILGGANGGALDLGIGDMEMVGADLIWAVYNVATRKLTPPGPQMANVTVILAAGALALGLAAWVADAPFAMPGPAASAALLAMSLLGSVLAYLFWTTAIAGLGAGRAALFMNLVPVCATVIDGLMGHIPNHGQLAGGCLVILAVLYAMTPKRRPVVA